MSKKNTFEKFCEELVEEDIYFAEVARKKLKAKYGNDKEALLTIKAEAQEDDYNVFWAMRLSILALLVSTISVIKDLVPETGVQWLDIFMEVLYFGTLIFLFAKIGLCDKYASVRKWRKYVLVVIDDLIKESTAKDNKK